MSYQIYRQGGSWIVTYGRAIVFSGATKQEANDYVAWHREQVKAKA